MSAESRAKISAAKRGKPKKPLSAESCAKISEANRKRGPRSIETRVKISLSLRKVKTND